MAIAPEQRTAQARAAARRITATRAQLLAYLAALWGSLPDYRAAGERVWLARAVPAVLGAQRQVASLTDASLTAALAAQGVAATPAGVAGAVATGAALRGGVATVEVYRRALVTVWTALSKGRPFDDAVTAGLNRALEMAATDTQLARTHAARSVMERSPHVVGYRRVVESAHPCALCLIASTQRYHKADLMPIHPRCDCDVMPIVAGAPVGQVLDQGLLDQINAIVRDKLGADTRTLTYGDYRSVSVVRQHGEIGPVLSWRGQHFDGPAAIAS
jgi:hypothetical protein